MELSTIKNKIGSFSSGAAERVKGNWNNLSTTGKVAAIGTTILLAGAAVAANFLSAGLLSAATALSVGASHLIAHITVAVLGALGLAIPACLILKKNQAQPIVKTEEQVVVEQQPAQEAVKSSRLVELKNASVQFVRNHPRLVIAGSVLAIGVLSAGLMGAQRRGAVASFSKDAAVKALSQGKKLGSQALSKGSDLGNQALSKGKKAASVSKGFAKAGLVRSQTALSNMKPNFLVKK
jgi:hypothetical protein